MLPEFDPGITLSFNHLNLPIKNGNTNLNTEKASEHGSAYSGNSHKKLQLESVLHTAPKFFLIATLSLVLSYLVLSSDFLFN